MGLNINVDDKINTPTEQQLMEAQYAVIGSMLIDESCIGDLMGQIRAEDFTSEEMFELFIAIRELYNNKQPIDPVIVNDKCGEKYTKLIFELMQITPTAANCMAYAKIMKEQAVIRRIQKIGTSLMMTRGMEDARELADKLQNELTDKKDDKIVSFYDGFFELFNRMSAEVKPDYLKWGIEKLDNKLYVEPGDMVVIGGRQSSGKTMLALQFAWHHATKLKKRVGFFSLETGQKKIYDRMICRNFGIPLAEIKQVKLSKQSWSKLVTSSDIADKVSFDYINASGMTVQDIRATSMANHYDVIFIDYLQLIQTHRVRANRTEEVSGISRELHIFSQSTETTVIALAQLSRPEKGSQNREPTLADLRESGQIEQDADAVMLLYLKDVKESNCDRKLYIAKNKEGALGRITLAFRPEYMSFYPSSERTDAPPVSSRSKKSAYDSYWNSRNDSDD